MYFLFFACLLGVIGVIPIHFLSVEHLKLQKKLGKEKGIKIGEVLGLISGWGFFTFWIGIWISNQPRFSLPLFQDLINFGPVINLSIPLLHFVIFIIFVVFGAWIAIVGVRETTLKVSETHRTEKIIKTGIYSKVRHPQYLGGLLAHIGISFFLSAWYSLISFPFMVLLIYLISWKEEVELIKEFGDDYKNYKEKVSMIIPNPRILWEKD